MSINVNTCKQARLKFSRNNIYVLNIIISFCCVFGLQVIGATAAKRYSGKVILSLAVFMWSLSTFITPFFAESLTIMIFLRVILGIGEGLGEFSYNLELTVFTCRL